MGDLRRTVIPIMLLGDNFVGKTSIIRQYIGYGLQPNESQLSTVGKESYIMLINLHGYDLKIKIWDTAGQERFKSMSVQVIKICDGCILVYSVNKKDSFKSLEQWFLQLTKTTDISKKSIIVIGNKLEENESQREVSYEEGKNFAESKGFNFYEVSSKTGENIYTAFDNLIEQLYIRFESEISGKKDRGKDSRKMKEFKDSKSIKQIK